ncbi:O-methyltransferase [Saccharibacillus alkalitolerans]|uniref:O-methyltransferase n=1 Tax=Saccharibacillus alkalitolerans TaxID=2705290 RepID=A0ABX0F8S3_9BACL|nr:O-methyltransferase [Saccharibacillus alkalitolerans]NGZ76835.1 O-methyltransferase [Saccharibacillus alkalitolerans]
MFVVNEYSLPRQLDIVFKELSEELAGLEAGTVFVQIRNNVIGKFGIRHTPLAGRDGRVEGPGSGLNEQQIRAFRNMAIESLNYKKSWTHGEISYEFAIRKAAVVVDAQFESNYNMASSMIRYPKNAHKEVCSELS